MIRTVTLNAAIDKTLVCRNFKVGNITRAGEALGVAGGKGLNVARSIHRLGGEVVAIGFAGGLNGLIIRKMLDDEGIKHQFTEISANSRMCLAIVDEKYQTVTEIYDPSPVIQKSEWLDCKKLIGNLAERVSIITFNGSLPAGLNNDAYYELIKLCKEKNPHCKIILDTSGVALKYGIKTKPFMIKPNKDEMEDLLGKSINNTKEYAQAVKTFLAKGIKLVVLSLGSEGVIFGYNNIIYKVAPVAINEIKSTVGCGDALVGGLVKKLEETKDVIAAVKYGVASATSNLTTKTQGYVSREQVENIFHGICIQEIS